MWRICHVLLMMADCQKGTVGLASHNTSKLSQPFTNLDHFTLKQDVHALNRRLQIRYVQSPRSLRYGQLDANQMYTMRSTYTSPYPGWEIACFDHH